MTILGGEGSILSAPAQRRESPMPEKTAAQKKAQQRYMEKFVRVEIRMEAEKRATIQTHAEGRSESVNAYINRAIDVQMERDSGPQQAPQAPPGARVVSLPPDALETAQRAAEATGEGLPEFVTRAILETAERDTLVRKPGGVQ